jgi:hypothetical protein
MDRPQRLRDALSETLRGFAADHDPLEALDDLETLERFVDDFARARVDDARATGASWSQIAERLGVTRQAAHKRFGRNKPKRSLELRLVLEKRDKEPS